MRQTPQVRALQASRIDRLTGAVKSRRRGGRRSRVIRRTLAVVLVLSAAALAVARTSDEQPGVPMLAVSHDLPVGVALTAADLQLVRLPAAPAGALTDRAATEGRILSGSMRRGEVLTDARVVPADGPDPGPNRVAVPIRLADPATSALLRPGVHVAVVVVDDGGSPRRVTGDAIVLAVPGAAAGSESGHHIGGPAGGSGQLAILAVPEPDADALAAAALAGTIAVRFT